MSRLHKKQAGDDNGATRDDTRAGWTNLRLKEQDNRIGATVGEPEAPRPPEKWYGD